MIDVFWWSRVRENKMKFENFGDVLVPYLLDRTTSQKYKWTVPNRNRYLRIFKKKWHYIIIGSILRRATEHSIIWGAGIMFQNSQVPRAEFLLVRGPLSRKRLMDLGYEVPQRFGDPALLISLFNSPHCHKSFKIGIVPHFLDYQVVYDKFGSHKEIKIVNLLTNNPQEVINEMNSCEKILSSSLHGIIVAHALNIPALWLKISDKLLDDIKFHDYYASLNIEWNQDIKMNFHSSEEIEALFNINSNLSLPSRENLDRLINDLIETYPFKKSDEFKEAIAKFNTQKQLKSF